jgi:hypothetical protein
VPAETEPHDHAADDQRRIDHSGGWLKRRRRMERPVRHDLARREHKQQQFRQH